MQSLYHILAVSQIVMAFSLSNPGRPIEAGMIILGETEVLDVAPIDLLNGISTNFIQNLPLSYDLKAKAPVVHFNWVTETGSPAKLTSNMTLESTVCVTCQHAKRMLTESPAFLRNSPEA
jgi:hypothetical protein